jgi:K+-transporting ATPase ATPase C chain
LDKISYGPAIRLAVISLVVCGLLFPLAVTGFAQVLFPSQANGSLVSLHGRNVGSYLIAQNFESQSLFHPRNQTFSASGVDPDITLQDAYSQIPRISNATGISSEDLKQIVDANVERTIWIAGDPYVNVLKLNLILIQQYPSVYSSFT